MTAALVLPAFGRLAAAAGQDAAPVWLVSTRCAPRCGDLEAGLAQIRYWRLEGCQWMASDEAAFRAGADPALPTTIFVHGNRDDAQAAADDGTSFYSVLKGQSAGRPFRYVIWSWPSDRIPGRARQDAQVKAAYSDTESYYLARLLRGGKPGGPVSLVGYSFGARIVTGSLELLAGGPIAGRTLPAALLAEPTALPLRPMRAVLIAAAEDADWLMPGHRDGLALALVDRVLVTQNGCDGVLRFYPWMYGRGGPQALGFAGPCGPSEKLEVVGVSCEVGRTHDWLRYEAAAELQARLAWYTFLVPGGN
jgi:hypothetical protein